MERRSVVFLSALVVVAVGALLVPEKEPGVDVLVVLLGAGVAATALTGYGGQFLLLCLGETFAVALGTASLPLGVLFQPVIAGMLCGDDWMSLTVGGAATLMAAAVVLVFPRTLFLLLVLLLVSAGMTIGLTGFEAWMRHRLSAGSAA